MTTLAYLQWVERKVLAHIQLRVGPQRVGPHGLLQPLADVIKLATKEGVIPANVNTFFYILASEFEIRTHAEEFDGGTKGNHGDRDERERHGQKRSQDIEKGVDVSGDDAFFRG